MPTAPERTTTTNPYEVPATIDAAYVNRVLEGLNAALGDVLRIVIRTRGVPAEVIDRLKAIYLERDDQNLQLQALQYKLGNGFAGMKDVPGDVKSTVVEMVTATTGCVFARLAFDDSALRSGQSLPPRTEWIGLRPTDPARDLNHYNPTPWMIATEGIEANGKAPRSPCDASS